MPKLEVLVVVVAALVVVVWRAPVGRLVILTYLTG